MKSIFFELRKDLEKLANPKKAKILQGFFKTGKGEYGEGDVFLGITMPQLRKFAQQYKDLDFVSIGKLLKSKIHEERLIALLILICKFNAKDYQTNILENIRMRGTIYNFYLKNTKHINNWDLVDLSADKIVGQHLVNKSKNILFKLAHSENLWERRIAVLATYAFIKNNRFGETLKIAEMLLKDEHDLIHKAVGWMLREVGKKDLKTEIKFLNRHCKKMPRTMLRYAIEKLPEELRIAYLKKN